MLSPPLCPLPLPHPGTSPLPYPSTVDPLFDHLNDPNTAGTLPNHLIDPRTTSPLHDHLTNPRSAGQLPDHLTTIAPAASKWCPLGKCEDCCLCTKVLKRQVCSRCCE